MEKLDRHPGVVLVDDNESALDMAKAALIRAKGPSGSTYEDEQIVTFTTFKQSMDYVRNGLKEPALFYIDLNLNGADVGLELIKSIRAISRVQVRCYVISGNTDPMMKFLALKSGADGYITKPYSIWELIGYIESGKRGLLDQLKASTDRLTGLLNRWAFEKGAFREISRSSRLKLPVSCLYIDIDDFTKFNDDHDHATGDRALKGVAQVLLSHHLARITDVVARDGGDEFVVLLSGADVVEAARVANAIREAFVGFSIPNSVGLQIEVHVSVGVATLTHEEIGTDYAAGLDKLKLLGDIDMKGYKDLLEQLAAEGLRS